MYLSKLIIKQIRPVTVGKHFGKRKSCKVKFKNFIYTYNTFKGKHKCPNVTLSYFVTICVCPL